MTECQPDFVNALGDAGLRVFGGTSNPTLVEEIAESLGISAGASKSQLHRARAKLRKKLGPFVEDWRR